MRAHPGRWTFNFGYVAVPQREYFAVRFDEKATVVSGTAARTRAPRALSALALTDSLLPFIPEHE